MRTTRLPTWLLWIVVVLSVITSVMAGLTVYLLRIHRREEQTEQVMSPFRVDDELSLRRIKRERNHPDAHLDLRRDA